MGQTDSRVLLHSLEEPSIPLSQSLSRFGSIQESIDLEAISMNARQSTESLDDHLERTYKSVDFRRSLRHQGGGVRKALSLANASATTKSSPYLKSDLWSSVSWKNTKGHKSCRKTSAKSSLRRLLGLPKFRTHPPPKLSPKGAFLNLPEELCLHILRLMDIPSIGKMARVSKTWHRLCSTDLLYQWNAVNRFSIHSSRIPLLMRDAHFSSEFWKTLYIQLDSGLTSWSGLALDPGRNRVGLRRDRP